MLGIDPGLANLGVGLIDGDIRSARHLHHACVTTDSAWIMPRRLRYLHAEVSRLLGAYQPDAVAIEDQILRKQADVAFKVGQAFGVVQLACAQAGVPVHAYGPMQVKQAVTGTGRAEKDQVIYMVKASLKVRDLSNNHAADALALALTHLACAPLAAAARR
ncbi:crossover junction endodeoxyribonuclease RuvC [Deinococcus soli (ex Cha et al. 2016)]|uniref:Crossover junction endodeoxyribonuclease RuvC n=2 Tax=Deinococcus soli (ex Cha et al. 2016) TaxID=1309411 RepID=A0AAE3XEK6_9DEIO|nr:crossover junction endodeoxyribonuclease RuvC [Deinococcus soli (ex Cha et al. 2016)]MDR6328492.1 crossover junction endodeoxyribonuclease RuvC [Deinococcus soli (ex Cha et al. 2016)]MDR6753103.1 crossover junction endodeoxyribonuclease RuvC [Deinococcus soli (ex Cha et al. 2016)]